MGLSAGHAARSCGGRLTGHAMNGCEFCDIVDATDRAFVVYEDDRTVAFLDQCTGRSDGRFIP